MTGLALLDVGSVLSYVVAVLIPALDALIPVLPSETAVIALGVATAGSADPRIAVLVALAAFGAFLGDNAAYLLGRRFGPVIGKRVFGGERGARREDWARRSLNRFGALLIIVCRFIPGGRTAVTLTCGLIGYPRRSFVPVTAAAGVLWAGYAFFLGRLGGKAFEHQPWLGLLLALGMVLAVSVLIEAGRRAWHWHSRTRQAAGRPAGGIAMPVTRRRWRGWLTALPAGLAGITALALGRGAGGSAHPAAAGASGGQSVLTRPAPAASPALPATVSVRRTAPAAVPASRSGDRHPMFLPGWRRLLEARWHERLARVTELSLAYHDTAERLRRASQPGGQASSGELRRLMQEAVAARRALADTEDALARVSAGRFGQCEQCTVAIPAADLARAPEARYCAACAGSPAAAASGATVTAATR